MLLLSISATGIIFIRKGGGREGGRSGSLRYAPQTNLCFLNYLCQLRFYKLNKSITQVYFEPAGRPEGSVAHLPAHSCAVLREPPGHSGTCVIQFPSHRTRFAAPAAAPERGGQQMPSGSHHRRMCSPKGKASSSQAAPLHNKAKPQGLLLRGR